MESNDVWEKFRFFKGGARGTAYIGTQLFQRIRLGMDGKAKSVGISTPVNFILGNFEDAFFEECKWPRELFGFSGWPFGRANGF